MKRTCPRFPVAVGAIATSCCIMSQGPASAAGFAIRNQSASGMGTALSSDTVNSSDATGIFSNPAVMSEMKGQHLSLSLNYTSANIKVKDSSLTNTYPGVGVQPNPNQGKRTIGRVSAPVVMPSIFGVHQISDDIHIGWSVSNPWATNTEYDKNWAGRYHGIKTKLVTTDLTIVGSYKVNDTFSFGGGPIAEKAEGEFTSAVDLGLIAYSNRVPGVTQANIGGMDAISKFKGDSLGYGFQLGALYKPVQNVRVGFSYRSEINHKADGKMSFTADGAAAQVLAALGNANGALRNSDSATLKLTQPAVYSLGSAYNLQNFTISGNASYTGWSTFKNLKIKYNDTSSNTVLDWKDSLYTALGGEYRPNEDLSLRVGMGYDQGVVNNKTRTPRTPDHDRFITALGGGYKISNTFKINAGYEHIFMSETKIKLSDQDYADAKSRGNLQAKLDIKPDVFVISTDAAF